MSALIEEWHLDALLGAVLLAYVGFAKWSEYRFRKRAIVVKGDVLKMFPHGRLTSYFLAYSMEGRTRIAEYCGVPMIREYKVGESVEILIDGDALPDVPLPDKWHNAPGAHAGNCSLPGSSIVTLWDFVYVAASTYLIVRSFGVVSFRIGS